MITAKSLLQFERLCRSDLALHFTWMFLIQIILIKVFGRWSILATIVFAFGKEIFDVLIKKGTFSETDLYATLIGGLFALLVTINLKCKNKLTWRTKVLQYILD